MRRVRETLSVKVAWLIRSLGSRARVATTGEGRGLRGLKPTHARSVVDSFASRDKFPTAEGQCLRRRHTEPRVATAASSSSSARASVLAATMLEAAATLEQSYDRGIGPPTSTRSEFGGVEIRLGRRRSEEAGHRLPAERSKTAGLRARSLKFEGATSRLGRAESLRFRQPRDARR